MAKPPSCARQLQSVGCAACWVMAALLCATMAWSREFVASEGELRAAVTVGVLRFTTWQDTVLQPDEDLQLCLVGKPISGPFLLPVAGATRIGNRVLRVNVLKNNELNRCQALVLGAKVKPEKLAALADFAQRNRILTVCDGCVAAAADLAMITLKLERDRVRFDVNLQQSTAAQIRLDASLLELASRVRK